jgi:hypothetical protein
MECARTSGSREGLEAEVRRGPRPSSPLLPSPHTSTRPSTHRTATEREVVVTSAMWNCTRGCCVGWAMGVGDRGGRGDVMHVEPKELTTDHVHEEVGGWLGGHELGCMPFGSI